MHISSLASSMCVHVSRWPGVERIHRTTLIEDRLDPNCSPYSCTYSLLTRNSLVSDSFEGSEASPYYFWKVQSSWDQFPPLFACLTPLWVFVIFCLLVSSASTHGCKCLWGAKHANRRNHLLLWYCIHQKFLEVLWLTENSRFSKGSFGVSLWIYHS